MVHLKYRTDFYAELEQTVQYEFRLTTERYSTINSVNVFALMRPLFCLVAHVGYDK